MLSANSNVSFNVVLKGIIFHVMILTYFLLKVAAMCVGIYHTYDIFLAKIITQDLIILTFLNYNLTLFGIAHVLNTTYLALVGVTIIATINFIDRNLKFGDNVHF